MIPDDRLEPVTDEHGGVWRFYKAKIPGNEFEYSFTLQFPPEIHNYIVATYLGTQDKGPLPENFRFTPEMVEDIARQWMARATGKGERPPDMEAFRAAIEETVNHRYHIEPEQPFNFDDLVEQRESVLNEPLDEWSQGYYKEPGPLLDEGGKPIDLEQIYKPIDEGQIGPEYDDFVNQDLLEPALLNFQEYINQVEDYMWERAENMRERAAEFTQDTTFETFGR